MHDELSLRHRSQSRNPLLAGTMGLTSKSRFSTVSTQSRPQSGLLLVTQQLLSVLCELPDVAATELAPPERLITRA